jgi:hypothetical protein
MLRPLITSSADSLSEHRAYHAARILECMNPSGMIATHVSFTRQGPKYEKDLARQGLAHAALQYAHMLSPTPEYEAALQKSYAYINEQIESESSVRKVFTYGYLLIGALQTGAPHEYLIRQFIANLSGALFAYPIALHIYMRIVSMCGYAITDAEPYIREYLVFSTQRRPILGRYFDHADGMIWNDDPDQRRMLGTFLLQMLNVTHKEPIWASISGKFAEVLFFRPETSASAETIYARVLQLKPESDSYIYNAARPHVQHILSERNELRIDDVHVHLLYGLCYASERLSKTTS